jgi:hypothetical protein
VYTFTSKRLATKGRHLISGWRFRKAGRLVGSSEFDPYREKVVEEMLLLEAGVSTQDLPSRFHTRSLCDAEKSLTLA